MKNNVLATAVVWLCVGGLARAQEATPSTGTSASSAEVQQLRQQVRALTEMVQSLQQQVNNQQAATSPASAPLPQNPEPPPLGQ